MSKKHIRVEKELSSSSYTITDLTEVIDKLKIEYETVDDDFELGAETSYYDSPSLYLYFYRLETDEEYNQRLELEDNERKEAIKRIQKKQELEKNLLKVADDLEKMEYLRLKKKYEANN